MPANLNALIRYKQIDTCLRNRYVPCTIQRLIEICTEALGEHRGKYSPVSERTIRDDIRVMKSDMLGFNAPIVCNNGIYSYSDPDYTVFNVMIRDMDLLKEVIELLAEAETVLQNKRINEVLKQLMDLTGHKVNTKQGKDISPVSDGPDRKVIAFMGDDAQPFLPEARKEKEPRVLYDLCFEVASSHVEFLWGKILEVL